MLFEAIQKNFVILQTMCEHQKRSNDLLARQNVKLKSRYDVNLKELTDLRGVYKKAVSELQFLRDKNAAFAEADADRQELLRKMDDLEREVERQKAELEESEFQLRVLRQENAQLKEEMLAADENLAKSKAEQTRLTDSNNEL